jgi:hypothetical protein
VEGVGKGAVGGLNLCAFHNTSIGCPPPPDFSAPRTPKAHLWFSGSVGQGDLPTAAKVVQLGWEFSLVIYPGSTPVGNATLVVANVLTCNKYSQLTS